MIIDYFILSIILGSILVLSFVLNIFLLLNLRELKFKFIAPSKLNFLNSEVPLSLKRERFLKRMENSMRATRLHSERRN